MSNVNAKVFMGYAHDDLNRVRKLYQALRARNVNLWMDVEELTPVNWKAQIKEAVEESRFFLICVSETALQFSGNAPKDAKLRRAYTMAMAQNPAACTIVAAWLDRCEQDPFSSFERFDVFEENLDSLAVRLGGTTLEEASKEFLLDKARNDASSAKQKHQRAAIKQSEVGSEQRASKRGKSETWIAKGNALSALGRFEAALRAYNKALEYAPRYASGWYNKGVILHRLKRYDEAAAAYRKAIQIRPGYAKAWHNLAVLFRLKNRPVEARKLHQKALQLGLFVNNRDHVVTR